MVRNEQLLKIAESLKPELHRRTVVRYGDGRSLGRGDSVLLDFGEHITGEVRLDLSFRGCHPDSPVLLRLQFAEMPGELDEKIEYYRGWLCSSWVQQEQIHVDVLPCEYVLPRRYAFRYVRIEVSDLSDRFSLVVDSVTCVAVTSADESGLRPLHTGDDVLDAVDRAACLTLRECMQDVFEDGPKRDRRLWLGDLRLQALANSVTFRNSDLVRRCLCLFAGMTDDSGLLPACVFTEPVPEPDSSFHLDYALLFVPALLDFYRSDGDPEFVRLLWPTARRQLELARVFYDASGRLKTPELPMRWFIDWNLSLDREASACGVHLYCLRAAAGLAELLGERECAAAYREEYEMRKVLALRWLYDPEQALFVSGDTRQVSMASQIWAVLGGLSSDASLFDRAAAAGALPVVSPYLYHSFVEALILLDEKEKALSLIRDYWGGMLKAGADTFWELYNPDNPAESPYGGTIVNSYCHAWSCTPSYFLRKPGLLILDRIR